MTATSDQIIQAIEAIHTLAKQSFHRRMVVFSGSNPWCMNLLKEYLSHANTKSGLLVSNQIQLTNIHTQRPEKLSQVLGTEYEILIWDGFSGINPDSFGIASGLVKGGGLFFLLLPELESFQRSPDPDYLRMCSDKASVNLCHTFFLQRLVNHLRSSDDICIVEEAKPLVKICVTTKTPALPVKLPSADQKDAIEAIKKVSFGHRHRPLVIKANRGRGKSSVLGIAAAQVYITAKHKMIITGPSKKTCDAAFKHYKIEIERHFSNENDVQEALSSFKFVALDSMLGELPSCHLLFIDEAAAIPTSILTTLLKHYPRLVYATTIHGYEGNGQGFAIRFHETLSNIRPQWQAISLYTPIRWQEHDPLETWFFNVLLLNTELFQTHLNEHINLPKKESLFPLIKTTLIDQQSLHKNELILKQIVSLLVIAHYQTSPSDIRLILDHPKVNIIIAYLEDKPQLDSATSSFTNSIVGVSLTIEEGGIQSEAIAQGIIFGERRPRGQLFPQALCASSADAKFLEQTCYRVMRIAVHPDFQQQGIGSALLDHLYEFAKQNNIDSVATSYGLSTELFSFWQKNHFKLLKLGSKIDGSSGLQSAMMMRAISLSASELFIQHSQEFFAAFKFNLNRTHQNLGLEFVIDIVQSFSDLELNKSPINQIKLKAFANSFRPYEESDLDVFEYVLSKIMTKEWDTLNLDLQTILVMKVLQNKDYQLCLKHLNLTGKKQFETILRKAVKALLDTEA